VSAQILTLLKFGLLALLYLFFLRVLFSVWAELRPTGKQQVGGPDHRAEAPAEPLEPARAASGAAAVTGATAAGTAPGSDASPMTIRRETVTASASQPESAQPPAAPAFGDPFASVTGHLVVIEPANLAGMVYDLGSELTVGRAPGCAVVLDDTFVSSLHARIYRRERVFILEDLGSTNGTFLNGAQVTEPTVMQRADRVRFGSMVLELQ